MALIWKKGLLSTYFSHFLVTRERHKKSFSTYLTYIHTRSFRSRYFIALPILQKLRICHVWFFFGVIPGAVSYSCHFHLCKLRTIKNFFTAPWLKIW